MYNVRKLKNAHTGRAYIVGSGKSILNLKKKDFKDGIVITINYSLKFIETLKLNNIIYSMQKDKFFFKTDYPVLVHYHESAIGFKGSGFVFNNNDFGLGKYVFSQISAAEIAKLMGCNEIVFYGFDAVMFGSTEKFDDSGQGDIWAQPEFLENYDFKIPVRYVAFDENHNEY